jgi:uncharacterized protein YjcR
MFKTGKEDTVTRAQVRRIFLKHRGASAELARELGLTPVTISAWLHDRFDSDRIEAAALKRAKELLEIGARQKASKERMRQELANAGSSNRDEV